MNYLSAFLVGGAICGLSQLVLSLTKLTSAHVLVGLTVIGAILAGFGLYQPLIQFAGAGALVPVSGFGSAITLGILAETKKLGWEGLFTGAFEITGLGLAAAILFGFISALLARPRG